MTNQRRAWEKFDADSAFSDKESFDAGYDAGLRSAFDYMKKHLDLVLQIRYVGSEKLPDEPQGS